MTPEERAAKIIPEDSCNGDCEDVRDEIASAIRAAVAEERQLCIADVQGAMGESGTDDPHKALEWAVQAILERR